MDTMQSYRQLNFTFMGLGAYNVSISRVMDKVFGYNENWLRALPKPSTISFDMLYTRESMLLLGELRRNIGGNFVVLSPSGVCQFCGSYYSAGTLKCKNCHGYVKDEIVSVKQSKFYLLNESTDLLSVGTEMEHFLNLEISVDDKHLDSIINTLRTDRTIGNYLPNSFRLYEEYVLCDCCLSIVCAGDKCPNCGGARLPFSEIVKIDRKCIFCGTKTYDGVMCKACGASLSGLSYREYQNGHNTKT